MNNLERIEELRRTTKLPHEDMAALISTISDEEAKVLYKNAREVREKYYGKDVYLRGLIEFTNNCKNNCYYCGIRRGNEKAERYRLSLDDILACCKTGYEMGYRTFVLQGGEDPYFTDERMAEIVRAIKEKYPDCAITLSVGEKEKETYALWKEAGADRYLLRHETINPAHYSKLHPAELSIAHRVQCLYDLHDLGYQVGCGMMIGSPYQTIDNLVEDIEFMHGFQPEMAGIGPFIPHKDTPFRDQPAGTLKDTLHLLAILRLSMPQVLLPATTALGTIHPQGREMGLLAGANVIMPNLSPITVRDVYMLYNGKICTDESASLCANCMERRVSSTGYQIKVSRGDCVKVSGN